MGLHNLCMQPAAKVSTVAQRLLFYAEAEEGAHRMQMITFLEITWPRANPRWVPPEAMSSSL